MDESKRLLLTERAEAARTAAHAAAKAYARCTDRANADGCLRTFTAAVAALNAAKAAYDAYTARRL